MDLYREYILDHYRSPRNYGRVLKPDFSAREENIFCGDTVEIAGKIKKGRIAAIKFRGEGCVISQASASILSEYIRAKSIRAIQKMKVQTMIGLLGINLTPTRLRCAELPLIALKRALKLPK